MRKYLVIASLAMFAMLLLWRPTPQKLDNQGQVAASKRPLRANVAKAPSQKPIANSHRIESSVALTPVSNTPAALPSEDQVEEDETDSETSAVTEVS